MKLELYKKLRLLGRPVHLQTCSLRVELSLSDESGMVTQLWQYYNPILMILVQSLRMNEGWSLICLLSENTDRVTQEGQRSTKDENTVIY